MKKTTLYIISSILLLIFTMGACSKDLKVKQKYKGSSRATLKDSIPRLGYKIVFPEKEFKNLTMLGKAERDGVHGQRNYGMMLRCLRFQNITRKIEKRYGLQKNLLLAMVMQESGGIDLLPNSSDDGGLGLCHMQPSVAARFGLKIYQDCNDLVNKEHGKAIRELISTHKYDKKKLIAFDDRFHPILNLDAAARMLAFYASGKQYKETPAKTAIYRYAGGTNYSKYYNYSSN